MTLGRPQKAGNRTSVIRVEIVVADTLLKTMATT